MQEGMIPLDKVTPEAMQTFLWVAAALVAFALAVWGLIDKIRKVAKEREETRRMLDNDNRRINSLEEGQRAVCRGVLALLNHELHNGNTDEMEAAQAGINTYLINR